MEEVENCNLGYDSIPNPQPSSKDAVFSSSLILDHVGEVVLTLDSDGVSWKLVDSLCNDESSCLGIKLVSRNESAIKFSDVYAVEYIDWGLVHKTVLPNAGRCLLGHASEMYRFTVHGIQRSKSNPSVWAPSVHTFGHQDLQECQMWVDKISVSLNTDARRPKNLLVFINPRSGKGNGCRTWEAVAPIFSHAKVKTKVTVTQRVGHAFDVMASMTSKELSSFDGVIAVGGDGFFNEILNGLLLSKHKSPYPPNPANFIHSAESEDCDSVNIPSGTVSEPPVHSEDHSPLLSSGCDGPQITEFNVSGLTGIKCKSGQTEDKDVEFPIPNKKFRFGIIPAGSTDAIVICTTGTRDPITSALHIVLGKKISLDVAQVVRWKKTPTSIDEPFMRYAVSFAGYGFYGDVISESERYRWMGPKRYDYAGTKVFLSHRSYEAEIAYLEVKSTNSNTSPEVVSQVSRKRPFWRSKQTERVVCRTNCSICNSPLSDMPVPTDLRESRWLKSRGNYLSVSAAVISCRNDKAPDGLVADAHLSDGFLHLILVKNCPHALYLWHLTELARKGGNPLDFDFVEHHKTSAFTFTSFGRESVWNVDGEIFEAHKLSAQVFQGLVNLFATGPEI